MSTVADSLAIVPLSMVPVGATAPEAPTPKRWTRQEYYRLAEQGWFQNQRVELIDGEILLSSPQSPQHAYASELVRRLLARTFEPDYWVRTSTPVTHGEYSEPEPDLCVVRGPMKEFSSRHPSTATLIVEISRSSLKYDRTTKQRLYASMGVPDYWVLDVDNRQLIVHRAPTKGAGEQAREYQDVNIVRETGSVSPLEKPDASFAVADMLPPAEPPAPAQPSNV